MKLQCPTKSIPENWHILPAYRHEISRKRRQQRGRLYMVVAKSEFLCLPKVQSNTSSH